MGGGLTLTKGEVSPIIVGENLSGYSPIFTFKAKNGESKQLRFAMFPAGDDSKATMMLMCNTDEFEVENAKMDAMLATVQLTGSSSEVV